MSILRRPSKGSEMSYEDWNTLCELRFMLMYHLHWDLTAINNFLRPALEENKSSSMKNYWLQEKEKKDQAKAHNAKLDEIARFVTKYISNKKSSKR